MSQQGELLSIALRSKPFAPMREVAHCRVEVERGLVGDWRSEHAEAKRSLVLLFEDQWTEVCRELGRPLPWTARRANLLIRGIPNPGRESRRVRIGSSVVLEVTGECDPCSRMDREAEGLRALLESGLRGGLTCRVIEGGDTMTGDPVRVEMDQVNTERGARVAEADEVLRFWFDEIPPRKHFQGDQAVDDAIRDRFLQSRNAAAAGALVAWEEDAECALALLILIDQFSRNLFRGSRQAFEGDALARDIAGRAIARGFDVATREERRKFFYLPFMHSEALADQDRCLELFRTRLPDDEMGLYHAMKHREVIAQFGRFPYRNEAMGRPSTDAEEAFLAGGGYTP